MLKSYSCSLPDAAAVYARISPDQAGTALDVNRQLADCRAEAARRGWTVAEEYVDNDFFAYTGKARPAYRCMLGDIADGLRDAVIVYHLDRLHHRPRSSATRPTGCWPARAWRR